jgi:hypothetical protein
LPFRVNIEPAQERTFFGFLFVFRSTVDRVRAVEEADEGRELQTVTGEEGSSAGQLSGDLRLVVS